MAPGGTTATAMTALPSHRHIQPARHYTAASDISCAFGLSEQDRGLRRCLRVDWWWREPWKSAATVDADRERRGPETEKPHVRLLDGVHCVERAQLCRQNRS